MSIEDLIAYIFRCILTTIAYRAQPRMNEPEVRMKQTRPATSATDDLSVKWFHPYPYSHRFSQAGPICISVWTKRAFEQRGNEGVKKKIIMGDYDT